MLHSHRCVGIHAATWGRLRCLVLLPLLFIGALFPDAARPAPLCKEGFERGFAMNSRKALDEARDTLPAALFDDSNRIELGTISFISNRAERAQASRLLLVLAGSAFAPNYMLELLERSVSQDTEVAVVEYPYLRSDFNWGAPFPASDRIATAVAGALSQYRLQRNFATVGIYASSLGGSILALMLQSGVRPDFLILDGIQESRPMPFVCRPNGWLRTSYLRS